MQYSFPQYMFTVGLSSDIRSDLPRHKVPPCQFIKYTTVLRKENKHAKEFKNVKVYAADSFHHTANGYIPHFQYITNCHEGKLLQQQFILL